MPSYKKDRFSATIFILNVLQHSYNTSLCSLLNFVNIAALLYYLSILSFN